MTVEKVIADLRQRQREAPSREDAQRWCASIDGQVRALWRRDGVPALEPEGEELLIPAPWEETYFHYCAAQTAFYRRDYEDYANSTAQFNELFQDYSRSHRRAVAPQASGPIVL